MDKEDTVGLTAVQLREAASMLIVCAAVLGLGRVLPRGLLRAAVMVRGTKRRHLEVVFKPGVE